MLTMDRVKNTSWKPLKTFICSCSTEWLPKRGLSAHPASAMPTMTPHKNNLATGVWPCYLQALLTFWGLFVSLGGDTGSEAEEMTDGLYKNWLPAPAAIRFLPSFSWKILQKDSFKRLIAFRGYIIASLQISDYLNFLQNHQSPIPGLEERRGWEDLKFLSLAADNWLLRKARCHRLDTFRYPFHWLHHEQMPLAALWMSTGTPTWEEKPVQERDLYSKLAWTWAHFRGDASGLERTCLWNELSLTVYRQGESSPITVCLGM